ncbi:MAG: hypothetical protein H2212_15045 [Ruminococcus sp.]|nr:hypothetical protein [Ruminococcus sp.]
MRVKTIKRYNDMVVGKIQEPGTVFETDDKRAEHLIKEGVAEKVQEESLKVSKTVKSEKEGESNLSFLMLRDEDKLNLMPLLGLSGLVGAERMIL